MKVHFIAIGGSAMHNLAIALSRKGYAVTGSDDEIFEPSKSRLDQEGILPDGIGWDPSRITDDLDAVILGMHARADNPELAKAKELGLEIFSYPEYIYEQSKDKKRVVIGGSHGKTTITSMILHALNALNVDVDYMVGAQLEGYDCMVKLTSANDVIILEGDEYLSSTLDLRPKFHLYQPHIALISGIAWDHINVFPDYDDYVDQFEIFCDLIQENGVLIYNEQDPTVKQIAEIKDRALQLKPYGTPAYTVESEGTVLHYNQMDFELSIFGQHNLENLIGAMHVCREIGIKENDFLTAMRTFTGAGKRLEKVVENDAFVMYKDYAHSPSKLKATTAAVKEQYPDRELIACMELHTFSSLQKAFLPEYKDAMNAADEALVYFSPAVVEHKRLEPITPADVSAGFGGVHVVTSSESVRSFIHDIDWKNKVLLMMSSGNFDGIDYDQLGAQLVSE